MSFKTAISLNWISCTVMCNTVFSYKKPTSIAPMFGVPKGNIWGIRVTKDTCIHPYLSIEVHPLDGSRLLQVEFVRITIIDSVTYEIPTKGHCKCSGIQMKYRGDPFTGYFVALMFHGKLDLRRFSIGCVCGAGRQGHENPFRLQVEFFSPDSLLFGTKIISKPIVVGGKTPISLKTRKILAKKFKGKSYFSRVDFTEVIRRKEINSSLKRKYDMIDNTNEGRCKLARFYEKNSPTLTNNEYICQSPSTECDSGSSPFSDFSPSISPSYNFPLYICNVCGKKTLL